MKQIFDTKQPRITYGHSNFALVCLNEQEVIQEQETPEGTVEKKVYSYDVLTVTTPQNTEDAVLQALKEQKIQSLLVHDSSPEVNSFYFGNKPMWLDKGTRVGLKNSIAAEKAAGRKETKLWFGSDYIAVPVDAALAMLDSVELYALECYNKTAEHKASILSKETLEEVEAYDFKAGYPQKVVLSV